MIIVSNNTFQFVFFLDRHYLILESPDDYGDLIDWHELNPEHKIAKMGYPPKMRQDFDEESEGVQSKQRWAYIKVNMEGIIVGRKICLLEHMGYSTLATQLEDMFGRNLSFLGFDIFTFFF